MHQICSVDSSSSWAPQRSGWKKASLGGESLGSRCFEPFKQETMLVTSKPGQQFQREDVAGETEGGISTGWWDAGCPFLGLEPVFPVDVVTWG